MVWRRWVTESSSSATQTSSDHLDRRLSNTRMRPPQSGLVQVGLWEVITIAPGGRLPGNYFAPEVASGNSQCRPRGSSERVATTKFGWESVSRHSRNLPESALRRCLISRDSVASQTVHLAGSQ